MSKAPETVQKPMPWLTVERLGALTDGVVAIIITILVLQIDIPADHDPTTQGLFDLLNRMSRDIIVYFLSFALIGTYWLQHHVIFHYIVRTNRTIIFLNLVFLFLLSLAPFATQLAATYRGVRPADGIFGVNYVLSGVALFLMWEYAVRTRYLLRKSVTRPLERSMSLRIMLAPALTLVGVVLSSVNFHLGALVYLSIPLFYLKHWLADTSWQDQN